MSVVDRHPVRMDIVEIMSHIPHRYPMLLVDRILEFEPGRRIVGSRTFRATSRTLPATFPAIR